MALGFLCQTQCLRPAPWLEREALACLPLGLILALLPIDILLNSVTFLPQFLSCERQTVMAPALSKAADHRSVSGLAVPSLWVYDHW